MSVRHPLYFCHMERIIHHWKKTAFWIFPAAVGMSAGLAYWYWVGCTPEGCAITGNPYIMGGLGALMGWSVGDDIHRLLTKKKK